MFFVLKHKAYRVTFFALSIYVMHALFKFFNRVELFEEAFRDYCKILENVPKRKEGKANKETQGAANVRNQRHKVVVKDLTREKCYDKAVLYR